MSYIRFGAEFTYVNGESRDYIFEDSMTGEVEDYGWITDEALVELIARGLHGYRDGDEVFREYLIEKLSDRMGVLMRAKPLTHDEQMKRTFKKVEEFNFFDELEKFIQEDKGKKR